MAKTCRSSGQRKETFNGRRLAAMRDSRLVLDLTPEIAIAHPGYETNIVARIAREDGRNRPDERSDMRRL
jgi:hypothetical protein